jgi:hypothetical protein
LRAFAAFVLVLASAGAEPAHGSAHIAELHAAEDAHGHEVFESVDTVTADGGHAHERVADGILVRSSQGGIVAVPPQPELHPIVRVRTSIASSLEQHSRSVATGPPPRLRAPPVA